MNIFISQPMNGKTTDEIISERNSIIALAQKKFGKNVEIIDSYFKNYIGNPLEYLGESIKLLSKADVVIFAKGWETARGCKIEHSCAEEYDIKIFEVEE